MNLHQCILTENPCYKEGRKIIPRGIMVHSTGANNPNLRRYVGPDDGLLGVNIYGNHWNNGSAEICVHAFIGKLKDGTVATYQTLPWDHRGWHAGGAANNTHISFEICEDALQDGGYFGQVYREAVELCAYLCKLYDLDPLADGVLIDHAEGYQRGLASNHGDIAHWWPKFGKSMDSFRAEVAAMLQPAAAPAEPDGDGFSLKMEMLRKGDKGETVKALQLLLIGNGYSVGVWGADGDFGLATENALKAYQQKAGLAADGIAGPATWGSLLAVA